MEALKQKWHWLDEKSASLSGRERGILCATLVVLILIVWMQVVLSPVQEQNKGSEQKMQQATEDITRYSLQMDELALKLEENPNEPLRQEQAQLQARLKELSEDIESQLSNLLPPRKMASVMQSVLADYQGLKLVSAKNLPVAPLKIQSTSLSESEDGLEDEEFTEAKDEAVIFVHGFEMKLEGSYFQTLQFIQKLEAMEGFYWQAFDYEVHAYPKAKITLQLNTLSLDEEWIGV